MAFRALRHVLLVHRMTIIYFWTLGYLLRKPTMENMDLQNQLNLKQTELNYSKDADTRKKIENEISILRLKLEIVKIRDRIEYLKQR